MGPTVWLGEGLAGWGIERRGEQPGDRVSERAGLRAVDRMGLGKAGQSVGAGVGAGLGGGGGREAVN